MKFSLIAIAACCAVTVPAFALHDNPGTNPPHVLQADNPGTNPPHVVLADNPGTNPPHVR
ncbi:MAG: hypothetical protein ABSH33_10945 [Steroidobacteraceae bacterium]